MNSRQIPPLLLVDGHNLLWAATFGFPTEIRSIDKSRELTGTFAFFAMLRAAIRDEFPNTKPEVIVIFDSEGGSNERKSVDANYKGNRPDNPEALKPLQFLPQIKSGLDFLKIEWIESEQNEADDVIASLISAKPKDQKVFILSRDRDFYQLVNHDVKILNTAMRQGNRIIDSNIIKNKYGVSPAQWCCFRALMGDSADNIPGIKGIGQKTAAKLLEGDLLLSDLPMSGRIDSGRFINVKNDYDSAVKWREMIKLKTNIALNFDFKLKPSSQLPSPAKIIEGLDLW